MGYLEQQTGIIKVRLAVSVRTIGSRTGDATLLRISNSFLLLKNSKEQTNVT
jgi:hypothetical protein